MTIFGANAVDVVVLVLVLVSALLALARGFVAEVLSIAGWVAAVFAVLYGRQYLEPTMVGYMGKGIAAIATTIGVLFIGTLAVVSAISYVISRQIRRTHLSAIDRSLGFLFGLLRGGLLACLLYIVAVAIWPMPKDGEKPDPNTLQAVMLEARSQPALAAGADILKAMAPDQGLSLDDLTKVNPLKDLAQPQPTTPESQKEGEEKPPAYNDSSRQDLGRMLDAVGDAVANPAEPQP